MNIKELIESFESINQRSKEEEKVTYYSPFYFLKFLVFVRKLAWNLLYKQVILCNKKKEKKKRQVILRKFVLFFT